MTFKLRIAIVLLALLLVPAARAEIAIDLRGATLDELVAARDAIQSRINEIESRLSGAPFPAGSYLVGRDLLAGVYVLVEDEGAVLPNFTLSESGGEKPLEFEMITNQIVVELFAGQTIAIAGATAYPAAIAPPLPDGAVGPGGYLVGLHLPAGDYALAPDDSAFFACYSLYDGPISTRSRIEAFVLLSEPQRVSLKDGQYLVLNACHILP